MKVNEVPQDGKRMLKTAMVQYAVNDQGEFEQVLSNGWDPGYYSHINIHDEFQELAHEARERFKKNLASPLEYFMYRAIHDLDSLSLHMKIPRRKVKKHLTPQGFAKLDDAALQKYALVLLTDVETIKNFTGEHA
jgi:hypothetical protein